MGCYNSGVITAPADKVFEGFNNIHDSAWSKNVITKVKVIGDKLVQDIGARRISNDTFHETLLSVYVNDRQFTYSMDDGPDHVTKEDVDGYVREVTVIPITENDTALVIWSSIWKTLKSGGVAEFCYPIYHALLQDLKSHFAKTYVIRTSFG